MRQVLSLTFLFFVSSISALAAGPTRRFEHSPSMIKGIRSLSVEVVYHAPEAPAEGLTADQISNEVALRLKVNGIGTVGSAEVQEIPGRPRLRILVEGLTLWSKEGNAADYVFTFGVDLLQEVRSLHNQDAKGDACTYSASYSAFIPRGELRTVTATIGQMVIDFARELQKAGR